MALLKIEELEVLAEAMELAVSRRASLAQGLAHLTALYPDLKTQLETLFAQTDVEFAQTIARVNAALNAVNVSNPDRVAYAQKIEGKKRGQGNNPPGQGGQGNRITDR